MEVIDSIVVGDSGGACGAQYGALWGCRSGAQRLLKHVWHHGRAYALNGAQFLLSRFLEPPDKPKVPEIDQ